jgi:hypothetical protein
MIKHAPIKKARALDRRRDMPCRRRRLFPLQTAIDMLPMEHFINKPLGANVLQIRHLEGRVAEKGDVHLSALLGVEAALYAVVHEGHEACGYYNTVHDVS